MNTHSPQKIIKAFYWLIFGNTAKRRRVRHEFARLAASMFGDFPVSEDHKLWREDQAFLKEYQKVSPGNPFSQERKFVLRELARFTRNVPGSMAECGCYQGASAFFLAKENPDVPLHLFDSFKGLSEPADRDINSHKDNLPWRKGDLTATEEEAKRTLRYFDNIVFHKGWIPERFPDVAHDRFRLVHIDVDLYQPTLDSLDFFYPRLNHRGIIVLDDYGFTNCPGAFKAAEEFMANKTEYILHLPTGQGVIIIEDAH